MFPDERLKLEFGNRLVIKITAKILLSYTVYACVYVCQSHQPCYICYIESPKTAVTLVTFLSFYSLQVLYQMKMIFSPQRFFWVMTLP